MGAKNHLLVTITKSSEFLLACSIPNIEVNLSVIREEGHGVDLDSESGDVLLFELTCLLYTSDAADE